MKTNAKLFTIFFLIISMLFLLSCKDSFLTEQASSFSVDFDSTGIASLKLAGDSTGLDFIKKDASVGDVVIRYRIGGGNWNEVITAEMSDKIKSAETQSNAKSRLVHYEIGNGEKPDMELSELFTVKRDSLIWKMDFCNLSDEPIDIGDIAMPKVFNTRGSTYDTRLNMHRMIAGHGSFVFWVRANGKGDRLVMVPLAGTKLEYFDAENIGYIHSEVKGANEKRGSWRQEHTGVTLKPKEKISYGFSFHLAKDYSGVRDVLYEQGVFDIHVVPGMVVPEDLYAKFSLRTKNAIDSSSIIAEYSEQTHIEYLGQKEKDVHIYKVGFERLGENLLTVKYGVDMHMVLEFFVTEPLETIYKKRAAFIVNNQQYRDKSKWYDGLYSLWDMRNQVLRGPDDTDNLQLYMVSGSDDPSNSKGVYLAEKNVGHPDADEITSLEYYLENFVWGKLQRTDKEHPYPYGIYGSEHWYLNRNTEWGTTDESLIKHFKEKYDQVEGTGLGKERMWRTFDYTTYIMLYYDMYLIAKQNPEKVKYLDADGYLERAFGTAKAYFEVPYSIYMPGPPLWSHKGYSDWAYKQGNFHEKYLVDFISALEDEGRKADADYLRAQWEKKVKYFIYDDPHPYLSEFRFDRTAYESTHAVARYALNNELKPDEKLWYDKNLKKWYSHPVVDRASVEDFMERQMSTNISLRGWLEASYYSLGSARSGGRDHLCYMSQMAGWSILDYALYYSEEPFDYLRLGYASVLSSWALVNCGTARSNYGYWFPGKGNDGAAGWNFKPVKFGGSWMQKDVSRGVWFYDGEIDHGLAGGINAACTVVVDDPLFGLFAYGGNLTLNDDQIKVVSRDGLGQRFHFVKDDVRFHMLLDRDGFAKDKAIVVDENLKRLEFSLENRSGNSHVTRVMLEGLPGGSYDVWCDGEKLESVESKVKNKIVCKIPVKTKNGSINIKLIRK